MEEFYKKVEEGGYDFERLGSPKTVGDRDRALLLDPQAWISLGKAMGWDGITIVMSDYEYNHPFMGGTLDYSYDEGGNMVFESSAWKYHWHKLIDHLAEGGTPDDFFKALLQD